ncbi:MAG TPA: CCA tRNA nucleotidyltransferase [Terracidiphilus sp.]|nr:CCA tRNA nucleotidyltransferase [Terracidiphilus sp.]
MPDYIYLLENRLSADQRHALSQLREAAREAGTILFLTGDAVRDLTSGHAVRDLEISVHGNALKLKKAIEKLGGKVWGEHEPSQSLYLCFPGTVRVDLISTHSLSYPKPGKPVYHPASIQEDLRRRDFTVNAMAISLNEGSFGLLMDPLNGAADIEARTLRLVSNYGFIEDPSLLIRATRYRARLGWELDLKTRTRYDNAKTEGVIEFLSPHARSQELEQIGHEEEGLAVLRALEAEGWMKSLFPAWTSTRADEEKLKALHELAVELLLQGVHADMSAAQMQLLTAKLPSKDLTALKKSLLRPGFVQEWNSLDSLAAGFQKVLLSKENAKASAGYKLFTSYDPEAVLWLGFTSKNAAIQDRFNLFLKVWPEARQGIPHALMQEMRITPELATYGQIVHAVFLELIDGRLTTPEEMRAYLEPHSPPAPPPQVTIKRPRVKRGAEKIKEQSFDDDEDAEESLVGDDDLDDIGGDEDEIDLGINIPKGDLGADALDEGEPAEDDLEGDEDEKPARAVKSSGKKSAPPEPAKKGAKPAPAPAKAEKPAAKPIAEKLPKAEKPLPPPPKPVPVAKLPTSATKANTAPAPVKAKLAPAAKKPAPAVAAKAEKSVKVPAKASAKPAAKAPAKAPAKPAAKAPVKSAAKAPAKGKAKQAAKPSKRVAKKPAPKPAKKR